SGYTLFWPAFFHNVIWLAWLAFIATPIGIFFAVLLDRELRGTAFYQSVFFLPVVLSLVIVGFIWELQFSPTEGFINNAFGLTRASNIIDWLGNPRINLFAILIAASWRHVGYIMVIYLSDLRSVGPTLRAARGRHHERGRRPSAPDPAGSRRVARLSDRDGGSVDLSALLGDLLVTKAYQRHDPARISLLALERSEPHQLPDGLEPGRAALL